jgi:hypothetical protein
VRSVRSERAILAPCFRGVWFFQPDAVFSNVLTAPCRVEELGGHRAVFGKARAELWCSKGPVSTATKRSLRPISNIRAHGPASDQRIRTARR